MQIPAYVMEGPIATKSRWITQGADRVLRYRGDRFRTLEFRLDEFEVADQAHAESDSEIITYETEPAKVERIRKLAALRTGIRKRIHKIRTEFRQSFRRLVRSFTHYETKMVSYKPKRYVMKQPKDLLVWHRVWDKKKVTELEFCKLMIKSSNISSKKRDSYRRRLKWIQSDHARMSVYGTLKNRTWRYNPREYVLTRIRLPKRRVELRHLARVPVRNWREIRLRWIKRMMRYRPQIEPLVEQLNQVRESLTALQPQREPTFNACSYRCHAINLADIGYRALRHNPGPYSHTLLGYTVAGDVVGWDKNGGCLAAQVHPWTFMNGKFMSDYDSIEASIGPDIPHGPNPDIRRAYELVEEVFRNGARFSADAAQLDRMYRAVRMPATDYCYGSFDFSYPGRVTGQVEEYRLLGGDVSMQGGDMVAISAVRRSAKVMPLDDSSDYGPDMVRDFEDSRGVQGLSLRNLDMRRDAMVFSYVRSLGELKDTKGTVDAGRDFWSFLGKCRGMEYVRVKERTSGKWHELCLSGAKRSHEFDMLAKAASARTPRRRLQILEKTPYSHLTKSRITFGSSAQTLSSLYLSWKFAVDPTVNDCNQVIRNGYHWATAVRRGLGQMWTRNLQHRTYHVLRRYWSSRATNSDLPKGRSCKLSRPFFLTDVMSDQAKYEDEFVFAPGDYKSLYSQESYRQLCEFTREIGRGQYIDSGGTDPEWIPYLETRKGLWLPHPCGRYSRIDEQTYASLSCWEHNARILESDPAVPEWMKRDTIFLRQVMHGLVFAKYHSVDIETALEDRGFNFIAKWHPYMTAWELSPLSFVTEWFSNLRQCATACDNLLSAKFADFAPTGRMWESCDSTVWAGCPNYDSIRLDYARAETTEWYSLAFKRWYDQAHTRCAFGYFSVPKTIRFSLYFSLRDPLVQMWRTKIKRYYRQPIDSKLGDLVPKPRVRVQINQGQGGTLALIAMQALRSKTLLVKGVL